MALIYIGMYITALVVDVESAVALVIIIDRRCVYLSFSYHLRIVTL